MFKFAPTQFLTFPTLILASLSLSACSGHGFGSQGSNGARYAGGNCVPAACSAGGGYGSYGTGQMGSAAYGSYGGAYTGGQSYGGKTRYGNSQVSGQVAGYQQQVYAQQIAQYPAPQYYSQKSYTQQSYTAPTQSNYSVDMFAPTTGSTSYAAPANCPAGTTASNDGTCLMGGSISASTTSYSTTATPSYSGSSYSGPSYSGYVTSGTSHGTAKDCPAGTTASSDGTCLMGGNGGYSTGGTYTGSSYSGPTYSGSSYSGQNSSGGSTGGSSAKAPPISSYDWSNSNTRWGSSDYVSPGTRSVDTDGMTGGVTAPLSGNKYPSQTNKAGYDYRPVRK